MDIATIKDKIYTIISGLVNYPVIWENQNAPQPQKPYLTLQIENINIFGDYDFVEPFIDSKGVRKYDLVMRVAVQSYADDNDFNGVYEVIFGLDNDTQKKQMTELGLSYVKAEELASDFVLYSDADFKGRNKVVLWFNVAITEEEILDIIEEININFNIDSKTGTIQIKE